jgi:hypothetical protein
MPHECILVLENRVAIANADTWAVAMALIACLTRFGALTHLQITAAATAPTIANGAAAGDTATFDNLQYPGVGSV